MPDTSPSFPDLTANSERREAAAVANLKGAAGGAAAVGDGQRQPAESLAGWPHGRGREHHVRAGHDDAPGGVQTGGPPQRRQVPPAAAVVDWCAGRHKQHRTLCVGRRLNMYNIGFGAPEPSLFCVPQGCVQPDGIGFCDIHWARLW